MSKAARAELMSQLKSLSESVKELLHSHPAANKSKQVPVVRASPPVESGLAPTLTSVFDGRCVGAQADRQPSAGQAPAAAVGAEAEVRAAASAKDGDAVPAAAAVGVEVVPAAVNSDEGRPTAPTSCEPEGAPSEAGLGVASIDCGPEDGSVQNQYTDSELTNYDD